MHPEKDFFLKTLGMWPALIISISLLPSSVHAAFQLETPYRPHASEPSETSYGAYRSLAQAEDKVRGTDSSPKAAIPSLNTYVTEFVPDTVGGAKRIFFKDTLPAALIGAGLTGLALTVDQRVKKYFQDRKPLIHVENMGDKIGSGYPEVGVGVALLGMGELLEDKHLADSGSVVLEAFLVNGIATEGLKYTVRRKRPNAGDRMSFPSGHASNTAVLAASISEMYDWDLTIAVPLYLTAAFVGASRIQANEHFLSDVVAGMTVGTIVGTSVARYHKEKEDGSGLRNLSLIPVVDENCRGMIASWKF